MSRSKKRHRQTPSEPAPDQASGGPPPRTGDDHGKPTDGGGKRSWFSGRGPALRGVAIFVVLMGLFYGLVHTPAVDGEMFEPYLAMIARISGHLLGYVGLDADVSGTAIRASGFSVTIGRGCDALEPIAAFFAAVLASPLGLRVKLPGILVGTAFLWLINLVRIVSLVLIGVHVPRAFDLAHGQVWQAAFIVLAIVLWAIWVQWATRIRAA